jgi:tetratricopeptide (TPR) repeat protein
MPIDVTTSRQKKIIIILGLVLLVLAAYWQVKNFEFVNYDDQIYVTQNFQTQSGITRESIAYTFTDLRTSNWHPLTMISHMLDWQLFGEKAGGHHWTSVIIHIFNTVLLFLLLNKLTGAIWRSALVAALFAVHPINVESVAWIAERKNVLSTFFWLLTMLLYVWYVKQPGWKRYLPVFLFFALGLMSKPMLVTLPFVLLLLDYWPLNRTAINTQDENQTEIQSPLKAKKTKLSFLILEKIPLFILTAISIGVTVYAAKSASTIAGFEIIPLAKRVYNAIFSYVLYLKKLLWPTDLAVFYPQTDIQIHQVLLAASLLVFCTAIFCKYYKKYPYLVVGWFWYLGTLVPVIGIVQVGSQAMADRYAYIPFIGIFIMLSWTIAEIVKNHLLQKITSILAVIILMALLVTTHIQVNYWETSFSLFERTLNLTKGNFIAQIGMGVELMKQNKIDEAIAHFNTAININPENPANYMAFVSLGQALSMQNKKKEAIAAFKQALSINPHCDEAYHKLGFVLFQTGQMDEASAAYKKAIVLNNDYPLYHGSLGNVYIKQGKIKEAIKEYNEVLRIQPTNAGAHNGLAMLLMQQDRTNEAVKHFRESVRLQPECANAHLSLAKILEKQGNVKEADYYYREAIRINTAYEDKSNSGK